MPRTRKKKPTDIPEEVLDHFAGPARPMSQADVEAVCRRLKNSMVERMLGGELTHHLGYPPGAEKPSGDTNQRHGTSAKTVLTEDRRRHVLVEGLYRSADARLPRHPDCRDGWPEGDERGARRRPATTRQTCLVHLGRASLELASWQDRTTSMPEYARS